MNIYERAAPRTGVVIGSSRPQRICPEIAAWVQRALLASELLEVEIVDLQDIGLPFLDEPAMPAEGHYEHEHTVRWSTLVHSYDAFVFVFPQYNWGYPAVLKNALDFLYHEWANKPAGLVTYGSRGGGLAANQLRQVLEGLHMRGTKTSVELKTDALMFTDAGTFHDISDAFADHLAEIAVLGTELHRLAATCPDERQSVGWTATNFAGVKS